MQDRDQDQDQVDPMLVVVAQLLDILAAEMEPRRMELAIDTHVVEVLDWGIGTAAEVGVGTIAVDLLRLRLHDEIHVGRVDPNELEQLELRSRNSHKGSTYWAQVVGVDLRLRCTRAQLVVDQSHSDPVTTSSSAKADDNESTVVTYLVVRCPGCCVRCCWILLRLIVSRLRWWWTGRKWWSRSRGRYIWLRWQSPCHVRPNVHVMMVYGSMK